MAAAHRDYRDQVLERAPTITFVKSWAPFSSSIFTNTNTDAFLFFKSLSWPKIRTKALQITHSDITKFTDLDPPSSKQPTTMNRLLTTLFLLLLSLVSSMSPQRSDSDFQTPSSSGVIVLNARNFDENLRDGKVWLVEFYAPWWVFVHDITVALSLC